MSCLDVGEGHVFMRVKGAGPALVLLHGEEGDGTQAFGGCVPFLAGRHSVITPDYAGNGASRLPGGGVTLDALVAQAAAVLRHAPYPADLAGFSLGAVVAAATAARHPELVRRLVLVGGWGAGDDARHRLAYATWAGLLQRDPTSARHYGVLLGFSPAWLAACSPAALDACLQPVPAPGMAALLRLACEADIRAVLADLRVRTLVIGLEQDQLVPTGAVRALAAAIAGSHYREINSGHRVFDEKPRVVADMIMTFLSLPA